MYCSSLKETDIPLRAALTDIMTFEISVNVTFIIRKNIELNDLRIIVKHEIKCLENNYSQFI